MKILVSTAVLLLALSLALTTINCGSTEVTTAKLAISQKQYDKAEVSLVQAVQKNSKDEEAWFLLGQVRQELKHYDEMNDAYNHALQISDAHKVEINKSRVYSWGQLYNAGVVLFNDARGFGSDKEDSAMICYKAALTKFSAAMSLEPDSVQTYHVAAVTNVAMRNYDAATSLLESVLKKRPSYAEAASLLGRVHYQKATEALTHGDSVTAKMEYTRSEEAFQKAYDAEPDSTDYITSLLEACSRTGDIEKAKTVTADAIEKDPDNKFFRLAAGIFELKQDRYPQAIDQLKKALEIDPEYFDARYNLGVAYLRWGDALRKASSNASDSGPKKAVKKKGAKQEVKQDETYMEKFHLALPELEKLVVLHPKDVALWTQLGHLYALLNMTAQSKTAFDKVDELSK